MAESDLATVGFVDFTRDEIAVDLAKDSIQTHRLADRATITAPWWATAGYAGSRQTNQVEIDLYVRPSYDDELGHHVLARLEDRARVLAAEAGHAEPWTGVGTYRQDVRTQSWLRAAGYSPSTRPSPGCGSTWTRGLAGRGAGGDRRHHPSCHRRGPPAGRARHRRGVVPRALRQRAGLVRVVAGSG